MEGVRMSAFGIMENCKSFVPGECLNESSVLGCVYRKGISRLALGSVHCSYWACGTRYRSGGLTWRPQLAVSGIGSPLEFECKVLCVWWH